MKTVEKMIRFGLYAVLLLPLVFTSRTMYPWHFGKTVLFQIAIDLLIILGAFYLYRTKRNVFRFHVLDWLVIAFFLIQLVATVFGVDPVRSFWGYQSRAQGVVTWMHLVLFYLLLRQFVTEKKQWQSLFLWIIGIGAVSSLIAWIGPHLSFFDEKIALGPRLNGLIGNPLFLAAYLVFPITLACAFFFSRDQKRLWRWGSLLAGIGMFVTLLYTQTRGVLVGMVAGGAVVWLLLLLFGRIKKTRRMIAGGLGAALFLFVFGLYLFNQKSTFIAEHAPFAARIFSIHVGDATVSTRFMAWQIAIKGWQEHPIIGWGPENFQHIFDRHYNPNFLRFSFAETVWDKPHNLFLEILATTGLVGFLTFLALLSTVFVSIKRLIQEEQQTTDRIQYIILTGGVVAYLVQSAFGIETTNTLELWYVALAFVGAQYGIQKSKVISHKSKVFHFQESRIGISVLILLTVIMSYFLYKNITMYRASIMMSDARDAAAIGQADLWETKAKQVLAYPVPFLIEQAIFTTQDISNLDTQGLINKERIDEIAPRVVEIFDSAAQKHPDLYENHFWLSEIYGFMGEYIDSKYRERSNQELMRAGELSPEQQRIPLLLSKNYISSGRVEEGIALLEALIAKDPVPSEPHWFLGLALLEHGDKERGFKELESAIEFGKQFRSGALYMIDLYAERKEYDKIIPLYRMLIDREPTNASLYASLAATYAAMGDKEHVVEYLNKAVQLDPSLREEATRFLDQQGVQVIK